jgi:hypothetical protein
MSAAFESAYRHLVDAWRRHDDLHRSNASIRELAEARRQLDDARIDALRTRNY